MIFYGKHIDPATRQILLILEECNLNFSYDLSQALKLSTPILLVNELYIQGAYAITEFLCKYNENLLGKDMQTQALVRSFIEECNLNLGAKVTNVLVYEKVTKMLTRIAPIDHHLIRTTQDQIKSSLNKIDDLLKEQRYLINNELTLADLTLAAHISCLDYFGDIKWKLFDGIYNWFLMIKSRPSFAKILSEEVPHIRPSRQYKQLDWDQ